MLFISISVGLPGQPAVLVVGAFLAGAVGVGHIDGAGLAPDALAEFFERTLADDRVFSCKRNPLGYAFVFRVKIRVQSMRMRACGPIWRAARSNNGSSISKIGGVFLLASFPLARTGVALIGEAVCSDEKTFDIPGNGAWWLARRMAWGENRCHDRAYSQLYRKHDRYLCRMADQSRLF